LQEVLTAFGQNETLAQVPVLIQTNGIEVGKGAVDISALATISSPRLLFEVSFKGTSCHEFELLTQKNGQLYKHQMAGYSKLRELSRTKPHIQVVAVLGIYHSSVLGPSKYAFVDPESGKVMFDDMKCWDSQFKEIWFSAGLKWVEPLRMSPKGVWQNLLSRCGPEGARILAHFPGGVRTNPQKLFPAKPKSDVYARVLCQKGFWNM